MKFAMCNEFCVDWPLDRVADLARDVGYAGIELAPFTLAPSAPDLDADARRAIRRTIESRGLVVVGLHWLLARTTGLHVCHPDPAVTARTIDYYHALIDLCADLGADRMIHGSPQQRGPVDGETHDQAWRRMVSFFQQVAPRAEQRGVTLCVEPLARTETDFINTRDQALAMIDQIGSPAMGLILDVKAMSDEDRPPAELLATAGPRLRHVHANDPNLSYPGCGEVDFRPILAALDGVGYDDWVSIEVFDFTPAPATIAREGLANLLAARSGGA